MVDANTKKLLATIPLLKTLAGPHDGDVWVDRLKEEYLSLIQVGVVTPKMDSHPKRTLRSDDG